MDRLDSGTRRAQISTPTVAESLRRLTEGVSRLVRDHLELAREELRTDLRKAGRDAAIVAAAIPGLFVGYVMLMVALALWIGGATGNGWGFAIVGAANLAIGGAAAGIAASRLARKDRPDMDRTASEIKEDGAWLKDLRPH
jgi:uncharacterized membrane protein YqjE